MEVFGRVYGIECLINHKIYVGKTIQPLEKRIQGHKWGKNPLSAEQFANTDLKILCTL